MWNTTARIIKESLQDNATGRYSSSRVIAMLVAIAATIFMWKLVIVGGMTIEYFVAYLAYGTGTASLNKFLDNRDGTRDVQSKEYIKQLENEKKRRRSTDDEDDYAPPRRNQVDEDDYPRPPRTLKSPR